MLKESRAGAVHYNLVKGVIEAIRLIFGEGVGTSRYADTVVRKLLKSNPKWGANDRKFLAHTVYEMVRWWRKLWYIYGTEPSLNEQALWSIAGIQLSNSGYELPPWKEFGEIASIPIKERMEEAEKRRGIRESIPEWLDETGAKELGEVWTRELHWLNREAPVIVRVNTLKTNLQELQEKLKKENIATSTIPSHPDALQLDVRRNIFATECFRRGLFEVQDSSSQEVAYFMQAKPSMRVIDACAGGGGKALHIAALMQNKGKIIALDLHEWKLNELRKRAARAGADMIETRSITSDKVIKRLEASADRVLLDVPCSGIGTLRRNPDIKWKLNTDALNRIREEQFRIISTYSAMVKPGGILVYSTCSILPSENKAMTDKFIQENTGFRKVAEKNIFPSEAGSDGFYMAAIERLDLGKRL